MRTKTIATGIAASALVLGLTLDAEAALVIKQPNAHPVYRAELEPHGNIILWHRYYGRVGNRGRHRYNGFGDPEFGGGFRATIELGDPAFVPSINNTVGITFGIDIMNCVYCYKGWSFFSPIGLQWNFFLTEKWSVFADLGFLLRTDGFFHYAYPDFFFMAGGRFHFNDKIALTMRVGYPWISVGVSFFVGS
jgi:hypothetical protein